MANRSLLSCILRYWTFSLKFFGLFRSGQTPIFHLYCKFKLILAGRIAISLFSGVFFFVIRSPSSPDPSDVIIFLQVLDRKSTRLNSVTNAHLVCRLLLEKKKQ